MTGDMTSTQHLPPATVKSYDWQRSAACRVSDGEVFFSPDGERGPARRARERDAKAFCATCPVRDACLRHALAAAETDGIWGGLSEHERRHLPVHATRAA